MFMAQWGRSFDWREYSPRLGERESAVNPLPARPLACRQRITAPWPVPN
ncbi:hypothetical protein C725_1471 [Pacificimonas flava]|uniref:Uncharacterized protein n=1 Tax=Pacificimonas flava TaxID=1234595 RepID=M2SDY2_9SPHN|nr:hypothetical protein C725_1471 [Pacificimonas flava]